LTRLGRNQLSGDGSSGASVPFAGWYMLGIACLAMFLSGPAQTYGVSVFVDPMLEEMGWSRSVFSTLYSVGTLASAVVLIAIGRLIDRRGNRLVMSLAVVGYASAMLVLANVNSLILLAVGFALLRTFGSSVLTLGGRTLVPNWFHSRAGRAFSVIAVAAMLSQALIPIFNTFIVDAVGWRSAWVVNAVLVTVILLPLTTLFIRNRPSDIGQYPDGIAPSEDDSPAARRSLDSVGLTVSQAMRQVSFWALIGASAVPSLVVTGLAFNQVGILTSRGLPASLAATTFAVEAVFALPTTLLAGWLVDKVAVRWVLMGGQVLLLVAMIFLLSATTPAIAMTYAALRGISRGVWMVAADVAWPSYFGRRYLGSIRSVGFAVGVFGAAIGPIPFGLAFDMTGSYAPAIFGLMALPILAAVALFWARPPRGPEAVAAGVV
jgi:MFS family permease